MATPLFGGEGEAQEDEEDGKECSLHGLLSPVRRLVSLGSEPWGEDTATSLREGYGEDR